MEFNDNNIKYVQGSEIKGTHYLHYLILLRNYLTRLTVSLWQMAV
jgi:hypothetical protein